jgi:hypothetical protein
LTKCKETDVSEIGIEEADFETARPISACIAPFQKLVPENRKHTDIPRYKFYRSGTLLASDTVRATLQINTPGGEQHVPRKGFLRNKRMLFPTWSINLQSCPYCIRGEESS